MNGWKNFLITSVARVEGPFADSNATSAIFISFDRDPDEGSPDPAPVTGVMRIAELHNGVWSVTPPADAPVLIRALCVALQQDNNLETSPVEVPAFEGTQPLAFYYTNHRGEYKTRHVMPERLEWDTSTSYYSTPGWAIVGFDIDTRANRAFRLDRMGPAQAVETPREIIEVMQMLDDAGAPAGDPIARLCWWRADAAKQCKVCHGYGVEPRALPPEEIERLAEAVFGNAVVWNTPQARTVVRVCAEALGVGWDINESTDLACRWLRSSVSVHTDAQSRRSVTRPIADVRREDVKVVLRKLWPHLPAERAPCSACVKSGVVDTRQGGPAEASVPASQPGAPLQLGKAADVFPAQDSIPLDVFFAWLPAGSQVRNALGEIATKAPAGYWEWSPDSSGPSVCSRPSLGSTLVRVGPGAGALQQAESLCESIEPCDECGKRPCCCIEADPMLFAYVTYRDADESEESEPVPVSLDIAKGLKAGADPRVLLADELRTYGVPAGALLRVSVELTDPGNTKDTTAERVWTAPAPRQVLGFCENPSDPAGLSMMTSSADPDSVGLVPLVVAGSIAAGVTREEAGQVLLGAHQGLEMYREQLANHGLKGAVANVVAFMNRGQPEQVAEKVQLLNDFPMSDGRARRAAQACVNFAHAAMIQPTTPTELALALIVEETAEVIEAAVDGKLPEYLAGLVGLIDAAVSAAVRAGLPLADAWDLVHKANMAKYPDCADCGGSGRVKIKVSPAASFFSGYDENPEVGCEACAGLGFRVYRNDAGKVIKPPGWVAPNVASLLPEKT